MSGTTGRSGAQRRRRHLPLSSQPPWRLSARTTRRLWRHHAADAFAGYNERFAPGWKPRPIVEAACWAHGRRKFFDLVKLSKAPIAIEAVRRIDEIFALERTIFGKMPAERVVVRQALPKPLVIPLEAFLREKRTILSAKSETAKAINRSLNQLAGRMLTS